MCDESYMVYSDQATFKAVWVDECEATNLLPYSADNVQDTEEYLRKKLFSDFPYLTRQATGGM